MSAGPSLATSTRGVDARPVSGEAEKCMYDTAMKNTQTHEIEQPVTSQIIQAPVPTLAPLASREDGSSSSRRTERTCMGLKHKWQERWRMQSAASSDNGGSLQQSSDPAGSQPCAANKYAIEGIPGAETNYRPFPQVLQT
jgi:hypothetical protein